MTRLAVVWNAWPCIFRFLSIVGDRNVAALVAPLAALVKALSAGATPVP